MIDKFMSGTETMCLAFMERYTPENAIYNYTSGLCLEALFHAAKILDRPQWISWIEERVSLFLQEDGIVSAFVRDDFSMDMIRTGNLYWYLYLNTGKEKYKKAVMSFTDMMKDQPRTPSGGFWHKKRYPNQMWLDGFYMSEPLLVNYALYSGSLEQTLEETKHQLELLYSHTVKENGLLLHAWDESKVSSWADNQSGCSRYVWSRAMGWVMMAIADILETIPETEKYAEYRNYFASCGKKLAESIIRYQDDNTGLWYQIPDMGGYENNYLETSGTLMFCYAFAKLHRMGYLGKEYRESAKKAWLGIEQFKTYYDKSGKFHLKDICKSAGLGKAGDDSPYRDGSWHYYTVGEERAVDNYHGVGPYILAGLETEYLIKEE